MHIEQKMSNGKSIKLWTKHVPVEAGAMQQLFRTSKLPIIHSHIAVMPDVHYGAGSTVGSIIPTLGAIIPAAVGVDIGCGMCAVQTSLKSIDLPETLKEVRKDLEKAIPLGQSSYDELPDSCRKMWNTHFKQDYSWFEEKYPGILPTKTHPSYQMGTLGSGNHFIELCLDTKDNVWVMLHSGSRQIGNRIGQHFIAQAKKEMNRLGLTVEDPNLSYLSEGGKHFDDYLKALTWAQSYAKANRDLMLERTLMVLRKHFKSFTLDEKAVNCHHNYVEKETHFGEEVYVTRKGAVSARKGELGIIPGSMGARSFIVEGLGNPESFNSCSHGAGRVMSRSAAKRAITLDEHLEDTKGVECKKDNSVLDESPKAYKNIDDVMKSQQDLVVIKHTLKQILCVKG